MSADIQIVLNYIDKVHGALYETGKAVHRYTYIVLLLCLTLIALSSGEISPSGAYSIAGFGLNIPPWFLLLSGMVLLLVFQKNLYGMAYKEVVLKDLLINLYGSSGFLHESMQSKLAEPLEYPYHFGASLFSHDDDLNELKSVFGLLTAIVFIFAPILTELYVGLKILELKRDVLWMVVIIVGVLMLNVIFVMLLIRVMFKIAK